MVFSSDTDSNIWNMMIIELREKITFLEKMLTVNIIQSILNKESVVNE